jgi:16S rRNA (guanine527-N7)-methyltransferase
VEGSVPSSAQPGDDHAAHGGGEQLLVETLLEAQTLGFLGARPIEAVIAHARGFLGPLHGRSRILDLGSGGGIPGLVIAAARPEAELVLLDASGRRTDWLRRVVSRLGWDTRVSVVTARAEAAGHEPEWRERLPAVVARGFASPSVTAECAAGLLELGGVLVVSEPPTRGSDRRWSPVALAEVGLASRPWDDGAFRVFEKVAPAPAAVPRRRVVRGT